jgi:hypothetical protein
MKLPIWVWNEKQKRYEVFPNHILKTFKDGKRGICTLDVFTLSRQNRQSFFKYIRFFESDPGWDEVKGSPFRFVLKE